MRFKQQVAEFLWHRRQGWKMVWNGSAPSGLRRRMAVKLHARAFSGMLLLFAGCHSAFVNATVENHTGGAISPLEVDYPSASFGTNSLPAGATYKYRFKILGSGPTKLVWTDARHQEHTAPGPDLREGQEGSLLIELIPDGVRWSPSLKP